MSKQQTKPTATSGLGLAVGAAAIITAITGIAFWLSYHHLHDVAAGNGLGMDPARAWAWPAVLDLFYLAGELLILRASYLRTVDPWAIALTAIGAFGSIGLNVAGVGEGAPALEYVVAAVPPVAALLAFGALMRQLHVWFARRPVAEPAAPAAAPVVTVERAEVPVPPKPEQAPALPAAEQLTLNAGRVRRRRARRQPGRKRTRRRRAMPRRLRSAWRISGYATASCRLGRR